MKRPSTKWIILTAATMASLAIVACGQDRKRTTDKEEWIESNLINQSKYRRILDCRVINDQKVLHYYYNIAVEKDATPTVRRNDKGGVISTYSAFVLVEEGTHRLKSSDRRSVLQTNANLEISENSADETVYTVTANDQVQPSTANYLRAQYSFADLKSGDEILTISKSTGKVINLTKRVIPGIENGESFECRNTEDTAAK